MAETTRVVIRMSVALKEQLDALAKISDKSAGWHIARALKEYMAQQAANVDPAMRVAAISSDDFNEASDLLNVSTNDEVVASLSRLTGRLN